ncbi:MAG: ATP-binding protein [Ruminococcus sp.]|nr:ATP-binding protein [Ruminococcus sp.]
MIKNSDILHIMLYLFNFVTIHNLISTFFNIQKGFEIQKLSAYFIYLLCVSIAEVCIKIPVITLLISWIAILRISLLYQEKLKYNLIYVTLILLIITVPQYITNIITGGLTSYIISAVLSEIISSYKHNLTFLSKLAVVIIPIISLIIELLFVSMNNDKIFLLSALLIFSLNTIVYFLNKSLSVNYIKNAEMAILEKENELYCRQCEIMQSSTDDLQSFRHDLNNQFIAVSELLSAKKYDDVQNMLHKLYEQTQANEIYSNTGNTAIDSIINYKFQNALNDMIDIETQIAVPFDIKIDTVDIITILGNLLDNALTAVMQTENRRILLKLAYTKGRLIIRVSNTYSNEIKYSGDDIITTKPDIKNHGYGLKNIADTIEKYNGYMETSHNGKKFTVDILLYLN